VSLAPLKSRLVYLSGAGRLSVERRPLNGCLADCLYKDVSKQYAPSRGFSAIAEAVVTFWPYPLHTSTSINICICMCICIDDRFIVCHVCRF